MFLLIHSFIVELLPKVLVLLGDHLLQAYLDELVELHRRLMTLRERHILQQVRNAFSITLSRSLKAHLSWAV